MVVAIPTFKLDSLDPLNLLCDERKLLQNEESFIIVLTDKMTITKLDSSNHLTYQFPLL